jgi:hypothetical protein
MSLGVSTETGHLGEPNVTKLVGLFVVVFFWVRTVFIVSMVGSIVMSAATSGSFGLFINGFHFIGGNLAVFFVLVTKMSITMSMAVTMSVTVSMTMSVMVICRIVIHSDTEA